MTAVNDSDVTTTSYNVSSYSVTSRIVTSRSVTSRSVTSRSVTSRVTSRSVTYAFIDASPVNGSVNYVCALPSRDEDYRNVDDDMSVVYATVNRNACTEVMIVIPDRVTGRQTENTSTWGRDDHTSTPGKYEVK